VTRAEIEAIRGVGCEEMLRQLMERDLVAVGGRSEELGRPNVYQTTKRFLRAFGLSRIEDLPDIGPVTTLDPTVSPGSGGQEPPGPAAPGSPSSERS
jgi:segregation and condensation protein B